MIVKKDEKIIGDIENLDEFLKVSGLAKDDIEIIYTEKELKENRVSLLKKGTLTADKRFYFTERTAEKFVMDYASLEDDEKLIWKDTNKNIVHLSKEEAKPYVTEIKTVLRKVYGLGEQ